MQKTIQYEIKKAVVISPIETVGERIRCRECSASAFSRSLCPVDSNCFSFSYNYKIKTLNLRAVAGRLCSITLNVNGQILGT